MYLKKIQFNCTPAFISQLQLIMNELQNTILKLRRAIMDLYPTTEEYLQSTGCRAAMSHRVVPDRDAVLRQGIAVSWTGILFDYTLQNQCINQRCSTQYLLPSLQNFPFILTKVEKKVLHSMLIRLVKQI